jgi:hypothetical protein
MATFYGSLAAALTYHADRANTAWATSTDDLRTAALVRATQYIDGAYRSSFPGCRTDGREQTLEWPRAGAYDREGLSIDSDVIPVEIENATYEGALRELASPGSLAPDIKAGGGVVNRVKAGSVEVEFQLDGSLEKTFRAIQQALGSLLVVRSRYSGTSVRA